MSQPPVLMSRRRKPNAPAEAAFTKFVTDSILSNGGHFHYKLKQEIRPVADLQELIERIKSFRDERNWKQFHTPRNLAAEQPRIRSTPRKFWNSQIAVHGSRFFTR
jgi:hypothetical protein